MAGEAPGALGVHGRCLCHRDREGIVLEDFLEVVSSTNI